VEEVKWMKSANCAGTDTEAFFAPDDTRQYANKEMLTRICNACSVKSECVDYSLRYAVQGWWGNTTDKKRQIKRRQLNITPIQIVSERVYE
jgi:hypothetical protein